MLNKNGIILWHDYVPGKQSAKNVVNYLNEISKEKNISNIRNTSLCVFRNFDYRRGGRAVEGARLESVYRGNSIMGSNPILSAINF